MIFACGTDEPPTDQEYDEIASEVAPLIARDFQPGGAVEIAAGFDDGDLPDWAAKDASGSFAGTHAGFDWVIEPDCVDTGDGPIADPSHVDALSICLSADGWLDLPHYTAELHARKQWAIRGLQTDTIALEGSCGFSVASTLELPINSVTRSSELTVTGEHNLVVPKADPCTATGSVNLGVDGERTRTDSSGDEVRQLSVDVDVTLDGTGLAVIVIDGVSTHEVDLCSAGG